ncbi:hypothetical protein HPB49_005580 [Dermacentor silvarum]|uniref:Uncharacterized protein n=1 Tax=Dermacentor silvarum TaxID=543639 RepID=A0ACB8DVU6_DERSI|nr:hypothetical protein HPB49_005580 [Dermacentor silvarum]
MDLLFHPNCKIPNSQRSQIITWLSEIVQECSDVRAIAAHQSGRVDELRDQLRQERRSAGGALPPAAQTAGPIRTYAAAAHLGMQMPSTSTNLPPTAMAPGDVPRTDPDLTVPPPRDFGPRRDHAFIMFLTPIAPSAAPARDERSSNFTHVLEVDAAAFRSLMARGRILIGWTSVKVREDVHIPTCTYCATYGHSKRGCPHRMDPSKALCTKCAGAHLTEACSVRMGDAAVCCAECRRAERASSHPTGDTRCLILLERVARMRMRTNYG